LNLFIVIAPIKTLLKVASVESTLGDESLH